MTGATSGTWSISCRLPAPQRIAGARPPITMIGEPLKWALVRPEMPLVTPGPAVSTASPGRRWSLATASAANTADCSCRTSWIGKPDLCAASYSGNTWPPDSVNISPTPAARSAASASSPPCPSIRSVIPSPFGPSSSEGRLPGGGRERETNSDPRSTAGRNRRSALYESPVASRYASSAATTGVATSRARITRARRVRANGPGRRRVAAGRGSAAQIGARSSRGGGGRSARLSAVAGAGGRARRPAGGGRRRRRRRRRTGAAGRLRGLRGTTGARAGPA